MPESRSNAEIVLVGHTRAELSGTKLPSIRQVLQCMFHHMRSCGQTRREAATATIRKAVPFWKSAGIPTIAEHHSISKLDRLWMEHRSVIRHMRSRAGSVAQTTKQGNFVGKLDGLFDIAHSLEISKLEDKEALEFLAGQRADRSGDLRTAVDTAALRGSAENEDLYMGRVEASKIDQEKLRLSILEQELLDELKEVEKDKKVDIRVSESLQSYGASVISECEEKIELWTNRYNSEVERRIQETTELEENIEELKELLEAQRDLQNDRQAYINQYLDEQAKIRAEAHYWEVVHKSATMIQALWRGYMMRHQLGPYRKKPKKKKKSKRKKKKKKKEDK